MTAGERVRRSAGLALAMLPALLLAACQPLPHPFAEDRPAAALLRVRDVAGVAIAPIVGKPAALAAKLAPAVAKALLKHDIPASARTASLDSYQLYGRLIEAPPQNGGATVSALWRLYDAKGRPVGERVVHVAAPAADWTAGNAGPIARLAGLSADGLAPLLEDQAPVEAPLAGRTRIAVGKITGAPGDGANSLANAVAAVLKRQNLAIVAAGQKADLYVDAEITVAAVKAGTQHVTIVWRVRRADGSQIGTVGQQSDVARGLLDGAWGDTAYNVALAAGDGLMQLVARGAPPPKS